MPPGWLETSLRYIKLAVTSIAAWNLSSCLNSFTNDISNLFNSRRFLRSWSILQNCKFGWLTSEYLSIRWPWILLVLTCLPVCHASSLTACCCWDETIRRWCSRNIWGWEDVLIHVQTKCQMPSWNAPSTQLWWILLVDSESLQGPIFELPAEAIRSL